MAQAQRKEQPTGGVNGLNVDELTEEQLEEINERFWQAVVRIGERNAHRDPDDVLREVIEVVEEVRREMYEEERRATRGPLPKEFAIGQETDDPVVVVSNQKTRERLQQERDELRERFWQAVVRIGERNSDRDPDEVLREVTEVVEEVRQERYERARRAQGGR